MAVKTLCGWRVARRYGRGVVTSIHPSFVHHEGWGKQGDGNEHVQIAQPVDLVACLEGDDV